MKILLIGPRGHGKTALFNRFTSHEFNSTYIRSVKPEEWKPKYIKDTCLTDTPGLDLSEDGKGIIKSSQDKLDYYDRIYIVYNAGHYKTTQARDKALNLCVQYIVQKQPFDQQPPHEKITFLATRSDKNGQSSRLQDNITLSGVHYPQQWVSAQTGQGLKAIFEPLEDLRCKDQQCLKITQYIDQRQKQGNYTNIFRLGYVKSDKLAAAKQLRQHLQGQRVLFSETDLAVLRQGRLGALVRQQGIKLPLDRHHQYPPQSHFHVSQRDKKIAEVKAIYQQFLIDKAYTLINQEGSKCPYRVGLQSCVLIEVELTSEDYAACLNKIQRDLTLEVNGVGKAGLEALLGLEQGKLISTAYCRVEVEPHDFQEKLQTLMNILSLRDDLSLNIENIQKFYDQHRSEMSNIIPMQQQREEYIWRRLDVFKKHLNTLPHLWKPKEGQWFLIGQTAALLINAEVLKAFNKILDKKTVVSVETLNKKLKKIKWIKHDQTVCIEALRQVYQEDHAKKTVGVQDSDFDQWLQSSGLDQKAFKSQIAGYSGDSRTDCYLQPTGPSPLFFVCHSERNSVDGLKGGGENIEADTQSLECADVGCFGMLCKFSIS